MKTTLDEVTQALSYCQMRIRKLDGLTKNQDEEEELRGLKRELKRLKSEAEGFQMKLWDAQIYS